MRRMSDQKMEALQRGLGGEAEDCGRVTDRFRVVVPHPPSLVERSVAEIELTRLTKEGDHRFVAAVIVNGQVEFESFLSEDPDRVLFAAGEWFRKNAEEHKSSP
ncbi:MAG: hypothetical protein AAF196_03025 [Planctomycetota bacterium]